MVWALGPAASRLVPHKTIPPIRVAVLDQAIQGVSNRSIDRGLKSAFLLRAIPAVPKLLGSNENGARIRHARRQFLPHPKGVFRPSTEPLRARRSRGRSPSPVPNGDSAGVVRNCAVPPIATIAESCAAIASPRFHRWRARLPSDSCQPHDRQDRLFSNIANCLWPCLEIRKSANILRFRQHPNCGTSWEATCLWSESGCCSATNPTAA